MATARPPARLVLEDGTLFTGLGFGASGPSAVGEVVFNTAMTGYQEALTDPSYSGQILTMTAPEIGNYGVCPEDLESARPQVAGFVVRELSRRVSNHRASDDLGHWLAEAGVPGIEGIDTRALVRRLRTDGSMRGAMAVGTDVSDEALLEMARQCRPMAGANLAAEVSPDGPGRWTEDLGDWGGSTPAGSTPAGSPPPGSTHAGDPPLEVVALDCGAKRNIYRHLAERGCVVHVLPHDASADDIRALRPDGLFVSNGPGDPAAVERTIATLRAIAGEVPTFGICLGHQLLALALGATSYKLKFGHRGANQPVLGRLTGRIEITSQNHGFCVDPEALEAVDCEATHVHLNDGTLAGFRHRSKPIFAVQYHPEASPGPHDSAYLFSCFIEMMRTRSPLDRDMLLGAQSAGVQAP